MAQHNESVAAEQRKWYEKQGLLAPEGSDPEKERTRRLAIGEGRKARLAAFSEKASDIQHGNAPLGRSMLGMPEELDAVEKVAQALVDPSVEISHRDIAAFEMSNRINEKGIISGGQRAVSRLNKQASEEMQMGSMLARGIVRDIRASDDFADMTPEQYDAEVARTLGDLPPVQKSAAELEAMRTEPEAIREKRKAEAEIEIAKRKADIMVDASISETEAKRQATEQFDYERNVSSAIAQSTNAAHRKAFETAKTLDDLKELSPSAWAEYHENTTKYPSQGGVPRRESGPQSGSTKKPAPIPDLPEPVRALAMDPRYDALPDALKGVPPTSGDASFTLTSKGGVNTAETIAKDAMALLDRGSAADPEQAVRQAITATWDAYGENLASSEESLVRDVGEAAWKSLRSLAQERTREAVGALQKSASKPLEERFSSEPDLQTAIGGRVEPTYDRVKNGEDMGKIAREEALELVETTAVQMGFQYGAELATTEGLVGKLASRIEQGVRTLMANDEKAIRATTEKVQELTEQQSTLPEDQRLTEPQLRGAALNNTGPLAIPAVTTDDALVISSVRKMPDSPLKTELQQIVEATLQGGVYVGTEEALEQAGYRNVIPLPQGSLSDASYGTLQRAAVALDLTDTGSLLYHKALMGDSDQFVKVLGKIHPDSRAAMEVGVVSFLASVTTPIGTEVSVKKGAKTRTQTESGWSGVGTPAYYSIPDYLGGKVEVEMYVLKPGKEGLQKVRSTEVGKEFGQILQNASVDSSVAHRFNDLWTQGTQDSRSRAAMIATVHHMNKMRVAEKEGKRDAGGTLDRALVGVGYDPGAADGRTPLSDDYFKHTRDVLQSQRNDPVAVQELRDAVTVAEAAYKSKMGFVTGGAKAMGMDTSEVDRTLAHFESLYRVLGTHSPGDEVDKLMEGASTVAFEALSPLVYEATNKAIGGAINVLRAAGPRLFPIPTLLGAPFEMVPEWGRDRLFEIDGVSVGRPGSTADLSVWTLDPTRGRVQWKGAGRTIETKTRPYIEKQVRENLMGQWAKQQGIDVRALEKQNTPEQIEEYLRDPLASNTDELYAKEREKLAGLVRDVRGAKASRVPVTPEFKRVEEVK
jgi:hypothetical protein